jgi:hypothetical protein
VIGRVVRAGGGAALRAAPPEVLDALRPRR